MSDRPTYADEVARELGLTPPDVTVCMTTYKRADGELLAGDYGWVTDLDALDDDEAPVEVVRETWIRTSTRTIWHIADPIGTCEIEDQEPCEEPAVAWWRSSDGVWLQVCAAHKWTDDDGQMFVPIVEVAP